MGRPSKRIVILNLTDHEPEAVFLNAEIASYYFDTKPASIRRQLQVDKRLPWLGYVWMWADTWEDENNEPLPGGEHKFKIELPI